VASPRPPDSISPLVGAAKQLDEQQPCVRNLGRVTIETAWRGTFRSDEANLLHAEAFGTRVFDVSEWDWRRLVETHSLGWVTARASSDDAIGPSTDLVGFANVVWDGLVHAWIQDVMVAAAARHRGIGQQLVQVAADSARRAGCEWLHVDFEDHLQPFYIRACGFTPTNAGLLQL
jgi:GNAT superfamily N-acetyltransferase